LAATARKPVRKSKARSTPATRSQPPRGPKQIDLYYWPTPNGWKITIMLEECRLPYTVIPVNISKGDQFKPEFLALSPNNRMPAIVDHDGPGRRPISIFESGAILQYLGRKTGKLYPKDERGRVEVDQWLFWQMANQGPKAGEANHFRNYAAEKLPYAIERFANEMHRIYGVMNRRLADREFLAGRYSIADVACVGWASRAERFSQSLAEFPNVRRWLETLLARPAVKRGLSVKVEAAFHVDMKDPAVRAVLFGQK
jgi:GST-like protein